MNTESSVLWVGTTSQAFGTAFHALCRTEEAAMDVARGILATYFKDPELLEVKMRDFELTGHAEIQRGFSVVKDWMPVIG